jgi:hypothetical protein
MRRAAGQALLFPLLMLGTAARGDVEVAVGPNLQVTRGSRPDRSFGTGFHARGLAITGHGHAIGVAVEGLWLVPTDMPDAPVVTQQDVILLNRLRPPVGLRESLAIDLGAGLSHYAGARTGVHPTLQLGAALCGRLGRRWSYELGLRFALTPRLSDRDTDVMFAAPAGFVTRFGGMLAARL